MNEKAFILSDNHVGKSCLLKRMHATGAEGPVTLPVRPQAFENWLNGAQNTRLNTADLVDVVEVRT